MSKFGEGVAVAVLLCLPLGAWGNGFRSHTTVTYYLPAPVVYVPIAAYTPYPICVPTPAPVSAVVPQQAFPSRPYAPPTAAPPSAGPSTPEPPLAAPPGSAKPSPAPPNRSLGFGESPTFYDVYPVAAQHTAATTGDRHTVDFWNLTDQELNLRINGGSPQMLPRGKSFPVATGSQFTWQVEGRPPQPTRIDSGESGLEIVIRR